MEVARDAGSLRPVLLWATAMRDAAVEARWALVVLADARGSCGRRSEGLRFERRQYVSIGSEFAEVGSIEAQRGL